MKSGLERVAEELMGRRKWKHYQDVLTRQQLNLLDPSTNTVAVDDDELLNSAAAAVASSVASNAVPFTPALVAAAVGGNLLDQKGAATIVRNGHYQQDGELESKLATSNNQQVAVAAATDKQADFHPLAEAAAVTTRKNHFNENDTKPTATAGTPSPPVPASHQQHPVAVTLNNNNNNHHHHPHLLNQSSQLVEAKKVRSELDQQQEGPEEQQQQQREDTASREELRLLGTSGDGKTVNSVASPALSCSSSSSSVASSSSAASSAASTTTTATATTAALLSPSAAGAGAAELDDRKELVGKLAIKLEPTADNQNNPPVTPEQQSKLIKQEHCNNLLSSKIIINNNNSATNNNNNNNNISSGNLGDNSLPVRPGSTNEESTTGGGDGGSSKVSRSQPPTPVDWKPQDKCYFCVDGKLLTVNEAGELVPESGVGGPNALPKTELDHLNHGVLNDSDSDTSDSSEPDLRAVVGRPGSASTKSLAALLRSASGVPPRMTSLQSMAAQFAAVASLQGIQPNLAQFYNPLWYSQLQQQLSPSGSTEAATVGSSAEKAGDGTVLGPGGEQPLDLSAKPGTSGLNAGLMMSMMDQKQIYKAKPRLSPISGRRTYTEDELQSALQDILNGKLGTRRAAVQYGIPRSTLRNKVYKLAMEHKREMLHNISLAALAEDDDDKDSLEDEGKDDIYSMKLNQQLAEAYLRMYRGNSSTPKLETSSNPSTPPQQQRTPEPPLLKPIQSQTPQPTVQRQSSPLAAAANSLIDPSLLLQLQSLLLAGGIPGLTNTAAQSSSPDEAAAAQAALAALPELLKKLIQQQELITEQIKKATNNEPRPNAVTPTLNNGQPIDPRLLPFLQAQQQNKPRTASGTPETTSSLDLNDGGSDDSQVILKIPSYKPVPGSTPTMPSTAAALLAAGKNGEHHSLSTPSPPIVASSGTATVRDLSSLVSGTLGAPGPSTDRSQNSRPVHNTSPQQPLQQNPVVQPPNHLSVISSPMGIRPRSSSQSPPNSLLGGKSMLSINDVIARSISKNFQQHHQSDLLKQQMESMEQYKRPTISVIKNLGGTDISRFGSNPNITQMTAAQLANTGTGGKGTRPKRGKYRNYDRDSLVEAVKAVQRGEMSVHRAGSYYGVPHSTLEYKVKERHLMRPRKREPKPQPGLDGLKSSDLGAGSSVLRTMDKSKGLSGLGPNSKQQQQQQLKNQYASASPNGGLKMPMFDPSMASQLSYPSPFLWPHPASFPGLPMDFARQTAAGASAGASGSSGDSIFASPMMQRFQQEQQSNKGANHSGSGAPKTTRELAESVYDGISTNGSLLDDIIRHSLDKKPGEMPHGALFDQLMKTNLRTSSTVAGSEDPSAALLARVGAKRSATSPLNYLSDNIKRERASPGASSTSSTGSSKPAGIGSVSFNDHHHLQQQQQQQQLHLQQQQQRHLNTSTDSMLDTHRAELLAKNNQAVENLIKLREDLTSMSVAHHHKRTPMEDQHNGARDEHSSSSSSGHGHGRAAAAEPPPSGLLSHRLASSVKLPTEDSS